MGCTAAQDNVVLLFDAYHDASRRLHESFRQAGRDVPAVVIEENGFLPETVQSVYGYFLGDYRKAPGAGTRPRYFNEIEVPDFWEISSTGLSGKISDLNHERARIFYAPPANRRWVQAVDWLDETGTVRYSDHYNRWGAVYARTTFNSSGKRVLKSYFAPDGREVIVENFVTKDIILNEEKAVRIFNSKTEFAAYFLHCAGYDHSRLFFNSLATPFFVSCRLGGEGRDVLFWQEPVGDSVPGNMQMILDGRAPRTGMIYVQNRKVYRRLMELGADPAKVGEKGFVYDFRRANGHRAEALVCTNSDQLEQCEALITALPEVQFHIAALTEMSSKLAAMEKHPNVHLYPAVKMAVVEELFRRCDLYLDINHGNEILSAVQRAFLNNQVVFAFANTKHNDSVVEESHIYAPDKAADMVQAIRGILAGPECFEKAVAAQHEAALAEEKEAFLNL